MTRHTLFVRLSETLYRIERPWGDVPMGTGSPSDVACDADGNVYCQLRQDPYTGAAGPAVVVLATDGRRIAAWGGEEVADGHMLSVHPDGRVFVVDRDAQDGTLIGRCRPVLNGAHGMWLSPDGRIFLSEQNPPRLTRLVPVAG